MFSGSQKVDRGLVACSVTLSLMLGSRGQQLVWGCWLWARDRASLLRWDWGCWQKAATSQQNTQNFQVDKLQSGGGHVRAGSAIDLTRYLMRITAIGNNLGQITKVIVLILWYQVTHIQTCNSPLRLSACYLFVRLSLWRLGLPIARLMMTIERES